MASTYDGVRKVTFESLPSTKRGVHATPTTCYQHSASYDKYFNILACVLFVSKRGYENMGKWRRKLSLPRRWERNHLIAKYGAQCYLCSKPFEKAKDITFDHWEPLSKGGADTLDNYRLAHLRCNQLKGALTPEQFTEFQHGTIQWQA